MEEPVAPEARVDPLVGKTLDGRYYIEKMLGEGGMGVVYRSKHTTLGKILAVKVLRAEVSKDQEIVARFRQEAQSATSIGNEHIIDISDFGSLPDGSTYFVMEYLDGIALTTAMEQTHPLPAARTAHIAKQICTALGAAHERGIVHRDLKPDNIYLIKRSGDTDFVKVLDFGIAKVGGSTSKLTRAGQVFGTPHYMSPEQCAGTSVDSRTDVYALGVILYEMSSGRVPFDADNLMGILTKHIYENPIPPRELPPPNDVPAALEAVIMKALAKKAEARYQTMAELRADLELVEQGLTPNAVVEALDRQSGGGQRDPTGRHRTGLAVDIGVPVELPTKSKLPLILIGGLVLVLAIGGIGAAFAMSGGGGAQHVTATPLPPVPPIPVPPNGTGTTGTGTTGTGATGTGTTGTGTTGTGTTGTGTTGTGTTGTGVVTPPPAALVHLTSDPDGCEVYVGDALVANTPYDIQKPTDGETVISLRHAGYATQTVRISQLTAGAVHITLPQQHHGGGHPTPPDHGGGQQHAEDHGGGHSGGSEVIDPWH